MTQDRTSTKLFIQHPIALDCKIVGILEQLSPGQSTHGRKIALVRTVSTPYFPLTLIAQRYKELTSMHFYV